jgi:cytochrome c peroxidase
VANIRSKHEEEGIRDFGNCVQCHRDPGVEPDKRGRVGESGQRKKKEQD